MLKIVYRALDALASPVKDMRVDHRGFEIFVAEEFLNGPDKRGGVPCGRKCSA